MLADLGACVYFDPPRIVVGGCSLSRYLYTKYACNTHPAWNVSDYWGITVIIFEIAVEQEVLDVA